MSFQDEIRSTLNGKKKKSASATPPPTAPPPTPSTTPPPARWPSDPNALVYHGLAGEIVQTLAPHTEADPVALLVQLLLMFGSAVGRGPHCIIEAARHGLNEFAIIVGDSATGRKGTSFNPLLSG